MAKVTKNKIALITGITGQDGSFLAELLLKKGYEVHGIIRRASTFNTSRINHIYKGPHDKNPNLFIHYGDLADAESIRKIIYAVKPDEIYNLAAQSHVKVSFEIPEYTANITGLGTLRILEAIKDFPIEKVLLLTGRGAPQEFIDTADLATEMREIKHPFNDGEKAKYAVEF